MKPQWKQYEQEQAESQRLEAISRQHAEPQALAEAIAEERAPDGLAAGDGPPTARGGGPVAGARASAVW